MKIYTKTGDDGSTGLLYGGRISKDDLRTQAYGDTDEAVAMLGLARSLGPKAQGLADLLFDIQKQLFVVGAELATALENSRKLQEGVSKVSASMIDDLEAHIDRMVAVSPLPEYFIVPGGSTVSAVLDVARTVVRRAERHVVTLNTQGMLADDCVLRYLNRLSDLLFTAARFEEAATGIAAPPSR